MRDFYFALPNLVEVVDAVHREMLPMFWLCERFEISLSMANSLMGSAVRAREGVKKKKKKKRIQKAHRRAT